MMHARLLTILCLPFLLVACSTQPGSGPAVMEASPESLIVEEAILWDSELDENWNAVALKQMVSDEERFKPQGMQYLVLEPLVVFGHRAAYVGVAGIHDIAGPNATLAGTPKSIAGYITKHYEAEFENRDGIYIADYKPNIKIIIEEHSELQGGSVVIGAYVGGR
ncbi:MAG: hypothetical protein R3242_04895 [Akkermansiaceae bacterium]|nr:hypothetical protein [Akkermansiaceae bacterium]